MVSLELAMSGFLVCLFWVVLLEYTTPSNIRLRSKVQWRDRMGVINKCIKLVVKS